MPDNIKRALPIVPGIPDLYWYKATIAKPWTDGDTVTVHIDLGFDHEWKKVKLRLARIDAFGNDAQRRPHPKKTDAIQLVNTLLPEGREFYLHSKKDKTEKWGRYLAEVYIQAGDCPNLMNLNDILVRQGLALYWTGEGDHPTGEIVA